MPNVPVLHEGILDAFQEAHRGSASSHRFLGLSRPLQKQFQLVTSRLADDIPLLSSRGPRKTRPSSSMDWVTFTCLFSSFRGPENQRTAVGYLLNHIQHVIHFQTSRPVSARYGHCGRWVLDACSFFVGIFCWYFPDVLTSNVF